jgi:hypothetical protein
MAIPAVVSFIIAEMTNIVADTQHHLVIASVAGVVVFHHYGESFFLGSPTDRQ